MATREQIESIIGANGAKGLVSWHVPHELNKIPDQIIRTYSPPVVLPLDPLKSCGVKVEPVQLPNGQWVGKFTEFTGPWDNGAVVLMKKLELDYEDYPVSLVQYDVIVDDNWKLAEYRMFPLTVVPALRDELIWETRNPPIYQYVTYYVWCFGS